MTMEDEVLKVRDRLHKLADDMQIIKTKSAEHEIKIGMLTTQVSSLSSQTATREQLDAAVLQLGEKVTNAVTLMSVQIKSIADDIAPIKKGIYWAIGIVLSSILLAVMALVLRRG